MTQLEQYRQKNHFMTHNFIEPETADENGSRVSAELREELCNLYGFVHGGLLMTMADCAAGIAARGDGRNYVTQNMNVHFIGNVKEGRLTADAQVLHRGKTVTLVRVEIRSEDGKLLAEASVSMFCVTK